MAIINSTYWRHALVNEFCWLCRKVNGGEWFKQINGERISGVQKILIGKKFPMTVRAHRLVIIELLRGFIDDSQENKSITKFYFFLI